MKKQIPTKMVRQVKFLTLLIGFAVATNSSIAQQIYCNGPWGGAGTIGDPARWTYIGQASNSADPATGKGAVSYEYSYFDRFVRIGDWLVFLNSVDPSGTGNYSGLLGDNGMQLITYNGSQWVAQNWSCSATGQSLTASQVSKIAVSYVSFNLACRFANWVATGSVSTGAYTFASSAANANVTGINYAFQGVRLPTENEFYKAAYYNPTGGSYNTYGATNLSGGVPVQTDVGSDATLNDQSGSPYQLSMAGLFSGANGTHCLWQIQAGQGDRSAYGLFNMVGGFHHLLSINQGGSQDATAGFMMFRPGNQLEGPSGQSKMWSYPGSASDPSWTMDAHLASPSFHLVIVGNKCGGCPTLAAPVVADGSRCGTGTVTTNLTTACTTSGSSLHIYSEVGLTNDITSQFTISGSTITTPSITSTKTYYAVCQSTTIATTCFSNSDTFTATVTTAPTATASATNATCNTSTGVANSDAKITIASFTTGQRYQYSSGATFSGSAIPASITAIPTGGVIANTLPNAAQSYTVRIYHSTDNTCYVDRVVSTTLTNCGCPTVAAPVVGDASRCGTGTMNATITTACTTGSTLLIFSDSNLATNITSQFTIAGTTITSPSITAGTSPTYYAACQLTSNTSCLSSGDSFKLTAITSPIATASATQPTCSGTNAPNNGSITIAGFTTGQRYQYSSGATFSSGSAIPASITVIPAGGVITSTLANTTGSYTVRVYDATDNTCYVDRVVNITAVVCCTTPTATASVAQPTCSGTNAPNNGIITIAGFTTGQRYQYSTGATFVSGSATPASITAIPTGGIITSGLANVTQQYTVRIYDATMDNCYIDRVVSITAVSCCTTPSAKGYGEPATCTNGVSNNDAKINLYAVANTTKYGYSVGVSYTGANYAGATAVSGTTATISGLVNTGSNMTYTIRLFNGSDACYDDIQITVPVKDCNLNCNVNGGADLLICTPTTTADLPDAGATQEWIIGTYNAASATINATTGVVNGMSVDGIYSFILRDKITTTCMDEVYIFRNSMELPFITSCSSTYQLPTASGITWSSVSGGATVTASGLISGMTTVGHYTFSATAGGCTYSITVEKISCACTTPNAGADITMCLPKTTLNLTDAPLGTQWIANVSNPAAATINATTGEVAGITTIGVYTFTLQTISDPTCKDDILVTVTNGDIPIILCNDGSTAYTLTAPSELTSVIWYNMSGTQVGTGNTLVVTSATTGLNDGSEAFYYQGQSTTLSGCGVELCCPVKFMTQSCCPVPNCGTVTVIKN